MLQLFTIKWGGFVSDLYNWFRASFVDIFILVMAFLSFNVLISSGVVWGTSVITQSFFAISMVQIVINLLILPLFVFTVRRKLRHENRIFIEHHQLKNATTLDCEGCC